MMLVCRELSVEYASGGYLVRPIERLDLELAKGELALLLGASGCGKTTLLSVLAAILRPSGGTAAVDGLEITSLQGRELAEYRLRKVGIVFQAFNLIPSLTASENVQIPLRASGLGPGNVPTPCSNRSLSPTAGGTVPAISPAASSSGWRLPAPSRSTRRCCSRTSRQPISTTSRSRPSCGCCGRSPTPAASSSSPRTTSVYSRSPTASLP
jgi:ABC-type sugar transport system ATPase subunit